MNYSFDAKKAKDDCVQWIRDYFAENGPDCNAIIGISGGKDSSVVAALCVEALGKDRVIGILLPQGMQPTLDTHRSFVQNLILRIIQLISNRLIKQLEIK